MAEKIAVALCMGSSCFARGNREVLEVVERLIRDNGWQESVALSGLRCTNRCAEGPNISINGTLYQNMDANTLVEILVNLQKDAPARPE
ncbi:MAG: (2Fe-2S) ferredoxin domain-containing protein [Planctomycetes bacterium]|nr:(2Fe-2S) ferredoxin domain-containing protein [Planctomycetota bacterium]